MREHIFMRNMSELVGCSYLIIAAFHMPFASHLKSYALYWTKSRPSAIAVIKNCILGITSTYSNHDVIRHVHTKKKRDMHLVYYILHTMYYTHYTDNAQSNKIHVRYPITIGSHMPMYDASRYN
ncbi:hypothetical protein F5Y00DRAFT_148640 [Daldinia vernicosa]|uniref:uncharacterized protein n=1 Tax=Daldinia vernicosa TaxID=114800 RepID=UPI002007DC73|nr:uncharacterized protein F5Y00DRAFT_148640 [Daldinia vernicosa]KAI0846263.1 hypothetical protein F5Y00DRAFT_148640 [Daldinia vernicosa]